MGNKPLPTVTLETSKLELTTGATFAGRYQIIEELGRGGMGKVYKVFDKETNERVALKLIKPEIASDSSTIERFRNELTTARKITHKSVCRMYDLNKVDGSYYITMEYVSGSDLKRLIRRTRYIPIGTAVAIATQICEGLAEAHRLGIVHRDLKPNNIMIDDDGQARIMDFGIARTVRTKGITGSGIIIGTPEYMSPEQVEAKEVDQRSDIYSLGIILYEMVTGRVPFEGETAIAIGVKHKSEQPEDPVQINAQVPEDLSRLILKCLEKDPENRYQSAGEVRAELEAIAQGMPTSQKIQKTASTKRPLTSREITVTIGINKLVVPALVLVGVVAAALIVWRLLPNQQGRSAADAVPTDKPSLAVLYFENNSGDEEHENWRSGLSEMLITDLSQSKYVHVLSGDRIYSLLDRLDLLDHDKYATEDLVQVASQTSVSHILRGSFMTAGEKFIINASLMRADTREVLSSLSEEGIGEASITDSIDRITTQLKAALDLSEEQISSDLDRDLSQITTESPKAFEYYAEGVRLHNQGRDREALALYQRAISIDPEFAMAYAKLGTVYGNLGMTRQGQEYIKRALELKDRLSEKELNYVEGSYYYNAEETWDKALEAHHRQLEIYPDDTTANHNAGLINNMLEEWEKAIPYYEAAVNNQTEFLGTYEQLAECYMCLGDHDKAKGLLEDCLATMGDLAPFHRTLARLQLDLGDYDSALAEAEAAVALEPGDFFNLTRLALVYRARGELKNAEDTYWKLMQMTEPGAGYNANNGGCTLNTIRGKYNLATSMLETGIEMAKSLDIKWGVAEWQAKLAYILSREGDHARALELSEAACDAAAQASRYGAQELRKSMHIKGLVQLAGGAPAEARKTADELKQFIESGMHKKAIRYYYHLMGRIEAAGANYVEATRLYKEAISYFPTGLEHISIGLSLSEEKVWFTFSLASALYEAGELDKAREQFESIIKMTPGAVFYGWQYTDSFRMLGKIHEELGNQAEAEANYDRARELLKDADPGIG
ncbi:MAG: protein kinase [Candidatus Aminicenantaceae bacterium]